ncbi:hypothetical protein [Sphingopyxis alaskensis]|jgi:hypothetical protein|uniref:hypothetical protein n=1 Tax=Sphingopyxis alaskensis TaxID=117207 RepID=UPI0019A65A34|nr:hypothetical protein [Sphingopyxis alaskensis]MBD3744843.1 hypothetical protein [Sphingopyxis terrae]MCM3421280.1 hypothetical protein [Sphingopyxis alaskensis]
MATTQDTTICYELRIEYFTAGERFAVETLRIAEPEGAYIGSAAAAAAEASAYFNDRVPELSYQVAIVPIEPDGPDEPEPPPAGVSVNPIRLDRFIEEEPREASVAWKMPGQPTS